MYRIPRALDPLLFLPGAAFEAAVRARSRFYAEGIFPQHRLPCPVISIGNITLGGCGKTPLVIYAAQVLLKLGLTPVVLTRGYGRRHADRILIVSPEQKLPMPASLLGDEPALVRRRIPSAWLGISKDRCAAGQAIAGRAPEVVFVLDDGFQHRKIFRDLDIVIVDRSQPLAENRIFPRGTLREPLSELRRCHILVLNGTSAAQEQDSIEPVLRRFHGNAGIYYCHQTIASLVPFPQWSKGEEEPRGQRPRSAFLVAAIGNPDRFRRDVTRLSIEVRGAKFFADHHRITPKEWSACRKEAEARRVDAIITTEKDAVKIEQAPGFPLLIAVQATEMADAEGFERMLTTCLQERP